jgi:hypothetical protein
MSNLKMPSLFNQPIMPIPMPMPNNNINLATEVKQSAAVPLIKLIVPIILIIIGFCSCISSAGSYYFGQSEECKKATEKMDEQGKGDKKNQCDLASSGSSSLSSSAIFVMVAAVGIGLVTFLKKKED